ncbi:MAG: hypothetical protein IPL47_10355 [Phyllobacteriaceae bacterium]|nr:hypothetical protein [Phyllobacteriaceae bacterium]
MTKNFIRLVLFLFSFTFIFFSSYKFLVPIKGFIINIAPFGAEWRYRAIQQQCLKSYIGDWRAQRDCRRAYTDTSDADIVESFKKKELYIGAICKDVKKLAGTKIVPCKATECSNFFSKKNANEVGEGYLQHILIEMMNDKDIIIYINYNTNNGYFSLINLATLDSIELDCIKLVSK